MATEVIVQKCKVDGNNFKNKSGKYMLPVGGGWEHLGGELPFFHGFEQAQDEGHSLAEPTAFTQGRAEALLQLHPKELALYGFMKSKGSFTKDDVQKHLDVSEATARNKINKFIDLGLVVMHGGKGNKNTYYSVV